MNNSLHEPQIIANAKNALGYFIVFTFVSCGAFFILGGMACPFIWLSLSQERWDGWTLMWQEREKKKGKTITFEEARRTVRKIMGCLFVVWFVLGWGLFVLSQMTYMN